MKHIIKIGIIGVGNMGASLAEALKLKGGYDIYLYDKDLRRLKKARGLHLCKTAKELVDQVSISVLAVKPNDFKPLLETLKPCLENKKHLVITLAAGIRTSVIESFLKKARVARVMPNIAARVGRSFSLICRGKRADNKDIRRVEDIFSSVGEVLVTKERFIDKGTAVSGSGPGYVFYFMEYLYNAARSMGFSEKEAKRMVVCVVSGSAELARVSGNGFCSLMKKVASPKGTTEAAFRVLNKKGMGSILQDAVEAAYKRAKEISKGR